MSKTQRRGIGRGRRLVLGLGLGGAGLAAIGLLALAAVGQRDVLIWNETPSTPVGVYLRTSDPVEVGAIVTVRASKVAPDYAAARSFTDPGDRFLKRVAASEGDEVCAKDAEIRINGKLAATRVEADAAGRQLPSWTGCRRLGPTEVFLLGDTSDSFDGRYWGVVARSQIEGVWRKL